MAAPLYCEPHGRMDCEDCAFVQAQERGVVGERPDLHYVGPGLAPSLTGEKTVEPLIDEKDVLIKDEDSDIDRSVLVAKGTRVPRELADRMPKRAAKPARG